MLPSRQRYRRWSLPTKWSFWAAVVGIPAGLLTLILAATPSVHRDAEDRNRNRLIFRVAQEMRHNSVWLSNVALAYHNDKPLPLGALETSSLMDLMGDEYGRITRHSYGEEKHIYQEALTLSYLAVAVNELQKSKDVAEFESRSAHSLHDVAFLNEFIRWYLTPLFEQELTTDQIYALGWCPFPSSSFAITGIEQPRLKYFVYDKDPMREFGDYLALID